MTASRWTKRTVWIAAGAIVAVLIAANAHLVYVAITSQPDCVGHIKRGATQDSGGYSAARSAC